MRATLLTLLAGLTLAVACSAPKQSPAGIPPAPAPPVGAPLTGLVMQDGWGNPRALPPPIDWTGGWTDSSKISADGKTLYFAYSQYDYNALATSGKLVITGSSRPGQKGPGFDIFEAGFTSSAGSWSVTDSTVNASDPNLSEASPSVDVAEDRMAYGNYATVGQLWISARSGGAWQPGVMLPANINNACVQDNPALTPDGKTIFFDSNRATAGCQNGGGNRQLFVTHDLGGGAWSDPVNVTPAGQGYAWQPFVTADGSELYWMGIDNTCLAGSIGLCVYKAPLSGDQVGTPELVMLVTSGGVGSIHFFGEPSLTADGRFFYFTYAQEMSNGKFHLSVGVASRP